MCMRASAVLLWSCYSIVAFACVIPPSSRFNNNNSDSSLSIETWRDDITIEVKFTSVCDGCFDDHDLSYIFHLTISSTQSVCGESDVVLNNKKLELTWDGINGIGSGIFPSDMTNGSRNHQLLLNYQAFCISSPQDSLEEYTAQILAVTFYPTNYTNPNERTSGFAVSFNSAGKPQIFRLVASPIEISDEDTFDSWLIPSDPFNVPISTCTAVTIFDGDLEKDLKNIHMLKAQVWKLQMEIKAKEQEIRKHLFRDCVFMTSRLKQCASLSCFIKTSFKIVPDVFRFVRYQFGPLPSSISDSLCRPFPNSAHRSRTNQTSKQNATTFQLKPKDISSKKADRPDDNQLSPVFPTHEGAEPKLKHIPIFNYSPTTLTPAKLFIKDLAILLLVSSIIFLLAKHCRNSLFCRRRRVDLAARREERRTLTAYRIAARRHRWRQWWNTRFGLYPSFSSASSPSSRDVEHSCQQQRLTGPAHHEGEGGNLLRHNTTTASNVGGGAIQAEILGFRRVLEFVGELVRPDGNNDSNASTFLRQQVIGTGNQRDISFVRRDSTTAPSSVAPLATIGSPRTSSVLSYETDSSVTLDSLDPETATMVSG
ncbi:hypothetical protein ACO22_05725 [Paracoccidioides brasiliensis]|uniref:GOLD domain-containing protein n=1 Tax=Paracoccidioides brasiliensis TaxID=121759 RepID=A0A1D2J9H3_PARBR|nr:hypothetical protein ACO22_05725 [Paracoccidioides brasiliensis]